MLRGEIVVGEFVFLAVLRHYEDLVDPIQARTAKLVALLAERLVDDGTITIDTLDEMLLQIVA